MQRQVLRLVHARGFGRLRGRLYRGRSATNRNPYHADMVCPRGDSPDRKHFVRELAVPYGSQARNLAFRRFQIGLSRSPASTARRSSVGVRAISHTAFASNTVGRVPME